MGGAILELAAEPELDIGIVADGSLQRRLQVGAVDHPIGSTGASGRGFTERQSGNLAAGAGADHRDGFGNNGPACQPRLQPELNEHAACIGRKLQARAGFFEPFGFFEYNDAKAGFRQCQRCRQSPDPGACDEDRA